MSLMQQMLMAAGSGVRFSTYIAIAHNTSPYTSLYPWSAGSGFGTKYANPGTALPGSSTGNGVAFSADGDAIAIAYDVTPYGSVYAWSAGSGFGSKYADPATLPTGSGNGVAFSPT